MQEIIKKLSKKHNLSEEIIEKIVKSQFEFLKDCVERGTLESVRLHHLGIFRAKPGRVKALKEKGYVGRQK